MRIGAMKKQSQNKPNSKTEDSPQDALRQKQNKEDSKIMAKDTPNVFYNCRESSTNRPYFLQNKANFKIGKMNISIATIKDYDKEQRTINSEPYSKQSQSKPILERMNVNFCATGYYESKPAIRAAGKPTYAVRRTRLERDGKQKVVWMHREIMKAGDREFCDHINRNGLDNRKANLRLATRSQNAWNRRKAKIESRSKYKGVSWYNRGKRWNARIHVNRKEKFLGIFADEIEAAKAYDAAARKCFGEFAQLNFDKKDNTRVGGLSEVSADNCL